MNDESRAIEEALCSNSVLFFEQQPDNANVHCELEFVRDVAVDKGTRVSNSARYSKIGIQGKQVTNR